MREPSETRSPDTAVVDGALQETDLLSRSSIPLKRECVVTAGEVSENIRSQLACSVPVLVAQVAGLALEGIPSFRGGRAAEHGLAVRQLAIAGGTNQSGRGRRGVPREHGRGACLSRTHVISVDGVDKGLRVGPESLPAAATFFAPEVLDFEVELEGDAAVQTTVVVLASRTTSRRGCSLMRVHFWERAESTEGANPRSVRLLTVWSRREWSLQRWIGLHLPRFRFCEAAC